MSSRRGIRSFLATYAFGVALALAPQTAHAEEIGVAAGVFIGWGPVYIAQEQGFFEDHGLDVTMTMFPSGRAAQEAIVGGAVTWGTVAETPVTFAALNQIPVRIIATMGDYEYFAVVATKEIAAIEDLSGKRVGYAQGTNAHVYLSRLLEKAGLKATDITAINLSPTDMLSSLSNEQIDAFIWAEPHRTQALQMGGDKFHVLEVPGLYTGFSTVVTLQSTIDEKPEVLVKSLRALMDAVDYINSNRDETGKYVAGLVQMDPVIAKQEWDRIPYEIRMPKAELIQEMERQAKWAIDTGLAAPGTEVPDFDELIVTTLYEQAQQR